MSNPKKTLTEVANEAIAIQEKWEEGAEIDAAFDGGEFSGPASQRAWQREIQTLADAHGFTFDEVADEINRIQHEGENEVQKQLDDELSRLLPRTADFIGGAL